MTNFEKLKLDTPEKLVDYIFDHIELITTGDRENYVAWLESDMNYEDWLDRWGESEAEE